MPPPLAPNLFHQYARFGENTFIPPVSFAVLRLALATKLLRTKLLCTDFYEGPIVPLPELRISSNGKKLKNLQLYLHHTGISEIVQDWSENKLEEIVKTLLFLLILSCSCAIFFAWNVADFVSE